MKYNHTLENVLLSVFATWSRVSVCEVPSFYNTFSRTSDVGAHMFNPGFGTKPKGFHG